MLGVGTGRPGRERAVEVKEAATEAIARDGGGEERDR